MTAKGRRGACRPAERPPPAVEVEVEGGVAVAVAVAVEVEVDAAVAPSHPRASRGTIHRSDASYR